MVDDHTHGEDGHVVIVEPDPEVQETEQVEEVAEAAVQIAEIEAERDVTLAKIAMKAEEAHDETEVEVLRGELRVLREMVERLAPDPEPEPDPVVVAVDNPEPEPEVAEEPAPEPADNPEPKVRKRSNPWWS